MAQQQEAEGLVLQLGIEQLAALEAHAPLHLLTADGEELEGLDHVVAEEAVEAAFDPAQLLRTVVGKGVGQVDAHHAAAVAHHVVDEGEKEVGQTVEPPQGQA